VRIVVPFAPGGTTDLMGRLLAQQLAQSTGGQFVVDSKPGASSAIGSVEVAAMVAADSARWGRLVSTLKIKTE